MLVKLPNKLVVQYWDFYKDVIRESVSLTEDTDPDRLTHILEAVLVERAQCWALLKGDDIVGGAITRIEKDDLTGQSRLLIFAHYVCIPVPFSEQYKQWYVPLVKFAKESGCGRIIAYITDETSAKEFARLTGSDLTFFAEKVV